MSRHLGRLILSSPVRGCHCVSAGLCNSWHHHAAGAVHSRVHYNISCRAVELSGREMAVFERAIRLFTRPVDPSHPSGPQQVSLPPPPPFVHPRKPSLLCIPGRPSPCPGAAPRVPALLHDIVVPSPSHPIPSLPHPTPLLSPRRSPCLCYHPRPPACLLSSSESPLLLAVPARHALPPSLPPFLPCLQSTLLPRLPVA